MKLSINGEWRDFPTPLSVEDLIKSLGLRKETVVAEVNLKVVQASHQGQTSLAEGDRVELIQFVGGG